MPAIQAISAKAFSIANKAFLIFNATLSVMLLLNCTIFLYDTCYCSFLLSYSCLYAFQAVQHTFIHYFPAIDINKHYVAYRRFVITICLVDMAYMLMTITFWQKSQYHPVYCALCMKKGFGLWVGILMAFHCIFLIGWAITLIQAYVNRRYYLLALGGYEVEQRIIKERQQQLRQMMIIEPDTNYYNYQNQNNLKAIDKYYKFEDVQQSQQQNYECSICLNKRVEDDHFVNAGCGHYYHQVCLIQWAQVNSNCPQCRTQFVQIKKQLINESQNKNTNYYFQNHEQIIEQRKNQQQIK